MAGIIAQETPDDQTVYAPGGYTRIARSWIDGFTTQIGADVKYNPVPAAVRWADRQWGNEDSPTLSVEDANAKYGIPNVVSFDEPVPEATAAERYNRARDDARRASIIDRSGLGLVGRLSAGAIAGALDPVNIGLSVAPELLLTRVGLGVGAASSVAERAVFYGASGAAGGAWLAPINAYLAASDARSYTTGDILADITLGAALGTAGPLVGAGLMRLVRGRRPAPIVTNPVAVMHSTPEASLETLSTSLRQTMTGLPVDVMQATTQVSYSSDLLRRATNVLTTATTKAARVLEESTGAVSAPAARRAGLEPIGETGSTTRDLRTYVQWRPSDAGTVASSDLRNIPNIVTRMTPVEETETGALWRTMRPGDRRIVETRLTTGTDRDGKPFERYTQTVVPKTAGPLSKFIDTDVAATGTYMPQAPQEPLTAQAEGTVSAPSGAGLADYRPGETSPYPVNSLSSLAPSRVPTYAANDLAALEQQVASTPSARSEPGSVVGESTPDTREIDAINAEQDEMIHVLKNTGQLDEADLKTLAGNEGEQQYFKDVAKARAAAVECLITNAAEAVDGE